jgi:hypothetical protein
MPMSRILEGEEALGSGNVRGEGMKQDAGAVISSIAHGNRRIDVSRALAIVGERETRKRRCANLASDIVRLLE